MADRARPQAPVSLGQQAEGDILRALAAILSVKCTQDQLDEEVVPREPVMIQVSRVKVALAQLMEFVPKVHLPLLPAVVTTQAQDASESAPERADPIETLARQLCVRDRINPDQVLEVVGGKPTRYAWMRETGAAQAILGTIVLAELAPEVPAAFHASALREALMNLADLFHQGRAVADAPQSAGYVQSMLGAAEHALAQSAPPGVPDYLAAAAAIDIATSSHAATHNGPGFGITE